MVVTSEALGAWCTGLAACRLKCLIKQVSAECHPFDKRAFSSLRSQAMERIAIRNTSAPPSSVSPFPNVGYSFDIFLFSTFFYISQSCSYKLLCYLSHVKPRYDDDDDDYTDEVVRFGACQ